MTEDAQSMWVEITRHAGRKTLSSISEHAAPTFLDGTEGVAIVCQVSPPGALDIRVQFSVSRSESFVRIRYQGDASRELVVDLIAGVERIIVQRRTWNAWFCPNVALSGLIDGLAVGVIVFAVYAFTGGSRFPRWAILTSLLLPVYRLVGFFKPYSAFETPQTKTLRVVGNWLTAGLAGLVALTAIGAYFDIEWLGF